MKLPNRGSTLPLRSRTDKKFRLQKQSTSALKLLLFAPTARSRRVVNETPMTRGLFPRYGRERAETSQKLSWPKSTENFYLCTNSEISSSWVRITYAPKIFSYLSRPVLGRIEVQILGS